MIAAHPRRVAVGNFFPRYIINGRIQKQYKTNNQKKKKKKNNFARNARRRRRKFGHICEVVVIAKPDTINSPYLALVSRIYYYNIWTIYYRIRAIIESRVEVPIGRDSCRVGVVLKSAKYINTCGISPRRGFWLLCSTVRCTILVNKVPVDYNIVNDIDLIKKKKWYSQ